MSNVIEVKVEQNTVNAVSVLIFLHLFIKTKSKSDGIEDIRLMILFTCSEPNVYLKIA